LNNFSSPCEESPDEAAVKVHVTPAVGASLLAKAVNDAACLMENRDALGAFASRLAPTEAALA